MHFHPVQSSLKHGHCDTEICFMVLETQSKQCFCIPIPFDLFIIYFNLTLGHILIIVAYEKTYILKYK